MSLALRQETTQPQWKMKGGEKIVCSRIATRAGLKWARRTSSAKSELYVFSLSAFSVKSS
jgi:hypothetical protein